MIRNKVSPTISVFFLLTLSLCVTANAQHLISAKAGFVNRVEGEVHILRSDGEKARVSLGAQMRPGDRLIVEANGFVEALLNPGSYLRLGANTEVRAVNIDLQAVRIEVIDGSVIVEVGEINKKAPIEIITPHSALTIAKAGLLRIDAKELATMVSVRQGEIHLGTRGDFAADASVKIKSGKVVTLTASAQRGLRGDLVANASVNVNNGKAASINASAQREIRAAVSDMNRAMPTAPLTELAQIDGAKDQINVALAAAKARIDAAITEANARSADAKARIDAALADAKSRIDAALADAKSRIDAAITEANTRSADTRAIAKNQIADAKARIDAARVMAKDRIADAKVRIDAALADAKDRIDVALAEAKARSADARAIAKDRIADAKSEKIATLTESPQIAKLNKDAIDKLDVWSFNRAQALTEANVKALSRSGFLKTGWHYDRSSNFYTFVPSHSWFQSPYGFGFFNNYRDSLDYNPFYNGVGSHVSGGGSASAARVSPRVVAGNNPGEVSRTTGLSQIGDGFGSLPRRSGNSGSSSGASSSPRAPSAPSRGASGGGSMPSIRSIPGIRR